MFRSAVRREADPLVANLRVELVPVRRVVLVRVSEAVAKVVEVEVVGVAVAPVVVPPELAQPEKAVPAVHPLADEVKSLVANLLLVDDLASVVLVLSKAFVAARHLDVAEASQPSRMDAPDDLKVAVAPEKKALFDADRQSKEPEFLPAQAKPKQARRPLLEELVRVQVQLPATSRKDARQAAAAEVARRRVLAPKVFRCRWPNRPASQPEEPMTMCRSV